MRKATPEEVTAWQTERVEKALRNIKESMQTLANYCEEKGCQECIMNNNICSALLFEPTIKAIEKWEGR